MFRAYMFSPLVKLNAQVAMDTCTILYSIRASCLFRLWFFSVPTRGPLDLGLADPTFAPKGSRKNCSAANSRSRSWRIGILIFCKSQNGFESVQAQGAHRVGKAHASPIASQMGCQTCSLQLQAADGLCFSGRPLFHKNLASAKDGAQDEGMWSCIGRRFGPKSVSLVWRIVHGTCAVFWLRARAGQRPGTGTPKPQALARKCDFPRNGCQNGRGFSICWRRPMTAP